MKGAIRAFRRAIDQWREKRAAAREAEKARKDRLEQMYESASDWLETAMGVRILQVNPRSSKQSLRFTKTEYVGTRYVPERRPGFGIEPDRIEYVEKHDTSTLSEYVHLGYTNHLAIELENTGGSNANGVIELRGEVLNDDECLFSGYALLEQPETDSEEYIVILTLYGQYADLCEPINRAYRLLWDSWNIQNIDGGTALDNLISELEASVWRKRDTRSLAHKIRLDKNALKPDSGVVIRLLARERGAELWNLLLQQRVVATRWLWGPVWDVDAQREGWEVRPTNLACEEWEKSEYVVECEDDEAKTELADAADAAASSEKNLGEALQKIAELYKAGLLTEEEFHRAKSKLIGPDPK